MTLSTNRLDFKRMTADDAPALFETVGDPQVMLYWVGGADPNVAATEQRIADLKAHWGRHGFGDWGLVEKHSQELIGFAGLHYIDGMPEVNLGYALRRSKWRQGFALEAGRALLAHGLKTLGLSTIVAVIWPDNAASIALAQRLGMRF